MKNLLIVLILLFIFSCKKEVKEQSNTNSVERISNSSFEKKHTDTLISVINKKETIVEIEDTSYKPIKRITENNLLDKLGYYVGNFEMLDDNEYSENASIVNRINISIDGITKDSIFGHSIVAGNIRPFSGVFESIYTDIEVKEPGDHKYDGVFNFKFYKNYISGNWYSNDKNLMITSRVYTLQKMTFEYNPEFNLNANENAYRVPLELTQKYNYSGDYEYINGNVIAKINASNQKLKNEDIDNLNKAELEILRNLIYARHGYSFKNRKMRYFFDSNIDWYVPVSTDVRNDLTAIEKQNIDLIKRYEQHAERYYDYFGR